MKKPQGFWTSPAGAALLREAAGRGLRFCQITQAYNVSRQSLWHAANLHGITFKGTRGRQEPIVASAIVSATAERRIYHGQRYDDAEVPPPLGRMGTVLPDRSLTGCTAEMCAI